MTAKVPARAAIEDAVAAALDEILVEYAGGARYPIEACESPPGPDPAGMAAVIRFRSLLFSGSLGIHAGPDVVLALSPPGVCAEGRDWIAELANQLLGRVKNKILRLGVPFWARPSTAIVGTYARTRGSDPSHWFRATTEHGAMYVLLQSNCPEGLFADGVGGPTETMSEGEFVMF